jgi:hypothetical protein
LAAVITMEIWNTTSFRQDIRWVLSRCIIVTHLIVPCMTVSFQRKSVHIIASTKSNSTARKLRKCFRTESDHRQNWCVLIVITSSLYHRGDPYQWPESLNLHLPTPSMKLFALITMRLPRRYYIFTISLFQNNMFILWFMGRPAAGKSTIASRVERRLIEMDHSMKNLDGDDVRNYLHPDLGFSRGDRRINNRRTIYIARLLNRNEVLIILGIITPFRNSQ